MNENPKQPDIGIVANSDQSTYKNDTNDTKEYSNNNGQATERDLKHDLELESNLENDQSVQSTLEPILKNQQQHQEEKQTKPTIDETQDSSIEDKTVKLQDTIVRLQADLENIRKRHASQLASAHKFALEKLMRELLPVLDSFEMGLQSVEMNEDNKALLEGMQLTNKILTESLEKHSLKVVAPQGGKFDPQQHEAITIIPRTDLEENTIVEVIQKGYCLSDRLLRPARVVVSGKS